MQPQGLRKSPPRPGPLRIHLCVQPFFARSANLHAKIIVLLNYIKKHLTYYQNDSIINTETHIIKMIITKKGGKDYEKNIDSGRHAEGLY